MFSLKRNTAQCLSTVLLVNSEIFHLERSNGMISQPISVIIFWWEIFVKQLLCQRCLV